MKPLEGITVLDLSRVLAVPFCTQVLSDLGATVWKVEPPWGDDTRRWGPPFVQEESSYYLSVNRGKKSVAIDLKDPRGVELVKRLAGQADVLVENFKVGDLARYGLDYSSLSVLNPQLVYASITGFGQTGPRADALGYDTVLQGMTGHEINYIARTALPFFFLMCAMVVVLVAFPELATWLPETMRQAPG